MRQFCRLVPKMSLQYSTLNNLSASLPKLPTAALQTAATAVSSFAMPMTSQFGMNSGLLSTAANENSLSALLPKADVTSALKFAAGAVAFTAFPRATMMGVGAYTGYQAFANLVLPMTPQRNSQSANAFATPESAMSFAGKAVGLAVMSGIAQASRELNDPDRQARKAEEARQKIADERAAAQRLVDETNQKIANAQRQRFLHGSRTEPQRS